MVHPSIAMAAAAASAALASAAAAGWELDVWMT